MSIKVSLKYKLFLYFLFPIVLVFAVYEIISLNQNDELLGELYRDSFVEAITIQSDYLDYTITNFVGRSDNVIDAFTDGKYRSHDLMTLAESMLKYNPVVSGCLITQLDDFDLYTGKTLHVTEKNSDTLEFIIDSLNILNLKAYSVILNDVKNNNYNRYWSEPYYGDLNQKVRYVAYVKKFRTEDELDFVIICEIRLEPLNDAIRISTDRFSTSRYGLITQKGTMLANKDHNLIIRSNIFDDEVQNLYEHDMREKFHSMLNDSTNGYMVIPYKNERDDYWVFWSRIEKSNWTLLAGVDRSELFAESDRHFRNTIVFYSIILVGSFFIFYLLARKFTKPILLLKNKSKEIAGGNFGDKITLNRRDEIGDLANEFNTMSFELKTREDELIKINEELEDRVKERTSQLVEKNKYITDSINYAVKIQDSILPQSDYLSNLFPEHFLYYQPKDIVSGDFYWATQIEKVKIVAAVDCTGHGVPGAFMSMIGNTLLNEIIKLQKITDPAEILNLLNDRIIVELNKGEDYSTFDGMDLAVCAIDEENENFTFAAAYRPLYVMKDGELIEIKGERKSIGEKKKNHIKFKNHTQSIETNTIIYLHTDGFPDQHNHINKKFGSRRLKQLLLEIYSKNFDEQKNIIIKMLADHKGDESQRDDITILGIKLASKKNNSD